MRVDEKWAAAGLAVAILVPVLVPVLATTPAAAQAAPPLTFHVVDNFLKLPEHINMAEVVGTALDSKGHVFVLNRGHTPILEFNPDGSFMRTIGEGIPTEGPHIVRVDPQDNLWYIDAGTNLVIKFDQQMHIQMVLGRRPEPWTYMTHVIERAIPQPQNFYQPTDVTWGPDGSIFVSDGYGNSRVVKISPDGHWLKMLGTYGSGPDQFKTPHSIAVDAQNNIYVADRGNFRIQVYDDNLNFVKSITGIGAPWALCITNTSPQYMFTGDGNGKLYKMDMSGKVLGMTVTGQDHGEEDTGDLIHSLDCRNPNVVYIGSASMFDVQKVTIK